MASALTTSPPNRSASATARSDLPVAVGPTTAMGVITGAPKQRRGSPRRTVRRTRRSRSATVRARRRAPARPRGPARPGRGRVRGRVRAGRRCRRRPAGGGHGRRTVRNARRSTPASAGRAGSNRRRGSAGRRSPRRVVVQTRHIRRGSDRADISSTRDTSTAQRSRSHAVISTGNGIRGSGGPAEPSDTAHVDAVSEKSSGERWHERRPAAVVDRHRHPRTGQFPCCGKGCGTHGLGLCGSARDQFWHQQRRVRHHNGTGDHDERGYLSWTPSTESSSDLFECARGTGDGRPSSARIA